MENPRISARVSLETKELVHGAADIKGVTVADFLKSAAIEEAHRVINREQNVSVSSEYANAFFKALEASPKPNQALLDAVKTRRV